MLITIVLMILGCAWFVRHRELQAERFAALHASEFDPVGDEWNVPTFEVTDDMVSFDEATEEDE